MEALFGAELSLPVKFFIAFAVVLLLIGAAAYLVRRFGAGALGTGVQRGRQPRLAVVDAAPIDNRRRLLIVRRDNVEHLLLVGGPTDVLVEANIVRATPQSARDFQPARGATLDVPPSLAAAAENDLRAAEPAIRPRRTEAEPSPWPLQHLGDAPLRAAPVATPPAPPPAPSPAPAAVAPPVTPPAAPPVAPPLQVEPAIHAVMMDTPPMPQRPEEPPRPAVAAEAAAAPPPPTLAAEDQNLADMAYRLEAALRRPLVGDETIVVPARPAPAAEPAARVPPQEVPPSMHRIRTAAEPAPTIVEPRPEPRQERPVYEGLEREMASLLGRPLGSS